MLVVCYTNHALDQFLESMMDIGVPSECMVRLGSKSSARTEQLSLQKQAGRGSLNSADWQTIRELKERCGNLSREMNRMYQDYRRFTTNIPYSVLLQHLQFEHPEYFDAFLIPKSNDGMVRVGKGGRKIEETELLERWRIGKSPSGIQIPEKIRADKEIWSMNSQDRAKKMGEWREEILGDMAQALAETGQDYNLSLRASDDMFNKKYTTLLKSKRIIACTTTAAAMYQDYLKEVDPAVLLVEEAGEVLESHIICALGPSTKQIILIGDHK